MPDAKYPRTEKNVQVAKPGNIPASILVTNLPAFPCLPLLRGGSEYLLERCEGAVPFLVVDCEADQVEHAAITLALHRCAANHSAISSGLLRNTQHVLLDIPLDSMPDNRSFAIRQFQCNRISLNLQLTGWIKGKSATTGSKK
ncbi:MAG TPA: hypothetical protein VF798_05180 [Burkholderiaceae bacterium]